MDDSITTRTLEKNILEAVGYTVRHLAFTDKGVGPGGESCLLAGAGGAVGLVATLGYTHSHVLTLKRSLVHVFGLIVLLFLTKPLSFMPEAVLAAIVFLIGVELILNACNVNLVAFSRYGGGLDGQIFAIFVIVLAAAEAAVALAIILQLFDKRSDVDTDRASSLRG